MEATRRDIEKRYPKYTSLIQPLKKRYYEDDDEDVYNEEKIDELRGKYDSIAKEYCDSARPYETKDFTNCFLVTEIDYDREDAWGCHPYSLLVRKEDKERASDLLKDGLYEYASCCNFHVEITGMLPNDFIRIFAAEADFPVIMVFFEDGPYENASSDCRLWQCEEY